MRNKLKSIFSAILPLVLVLAFQANQNFVVADQAGNPNEEYLAFAEVMPEVKGGLSNLYKQISYPEIAKKAGISGKVYLLAFINEKGSVEDVKVIKGIGGGCEEEAVKAVKNTEFIPGSNKGTPVKVKMSLPINFQLQ